MRGVSVSRYRDGRRMGSTEGRSDGRKARRRRGRCREMRRARGRSGEEGRDVKCRKRVSSIGWKRMRAMRDPAGQGLASNGASGLLSIDRRIAIWK
jgi:hypothetical protein